MLRAVSAIAMIRQRLFSRLLMWATLPLREVLITADVSTFANIQVSDKVNIS